MLLVDVKTKNLKYSIIGDFKSEFLPIVERVSLLIDYSFSFDVNKLYNLANKESLCQVT